MVKMAHVVVHAKFREGGECGLVQCIVVPFNIFDYFTVSPQSNTAMCSCYGDVVVGQCMNSRCTCNFL